MAEMDFAAFTVDRAAIIVEATRHKGQRLAATSPRAYPQQSPASNQEVGHSIVPLTSRAAARSRRNNRLSDDYGLTVSSSIRISSCVSLLLSDLVNTSSCEPASAPPATEPHIVSDFAGGTSCGMSTGLMDNHRRNRTAV